MTVLAVIPARLGATRLPRKPLRLLGGEPLILKVWRRISALGVAARCVVATDSGEVRDVLQRAGAECILTRDDHASGTDRVAEVVRTPEFAGYEVVLNVQGDEPFIPPEAVVAATRLVSTGAFPVATAAVAAPAAALDLPDIVKVVSADDGRALYFSRAAIPYLREREDAGLIEGHVWQHIGVYAYTREALGRWVALPPHPLERIERLEQLRPLAAGIPIGIAPIARAAAAWDWGVGAGAVAGGIDTEDDLARANAHWPDFTSRE
ncbi:MAG: 3-deoxy-manno-octulosonate cytidylyltransferase [Gemmatimonadota bacterium]|nr:3-deoxy-manno-octulosonate cytidylyltransferase [Gemmatimonadota bacterium]